MGALTALTPAEAAGSQAGGFRHRRAGLAARLAHKAAEGLWAPPKRVDPDSAALKTREGRRALARERIALRSHGAFRDAVEAGDLELFRSALKNDIAAYRRLSTSPAHVARRVVSRLVSAMKRSRHA